MTQAIEYPTRYAMDMEVFVHSHYETGEATDFDVFALRCDTWIHSTIFSAFDDEKWRKDNIEAFLTLPLDEVSLVEVVIDGDDYGAGWEWWIDNLTQKEYTQSE